MQLPSLSAAALELLKHHSERRGEIAVDDSNRETYRELARAGLMVAGHSFANGRESFYALTELGSKLALVLGRIDADNVIQRNEVQGPLAPDRSPYPASKAALP